VSEGVSESERVPASSSEYVSPRNATHRNAQRMWKRQSMPSSIVPAVSLAQPSAAAALVSQWSTRCRLIDRLIDSWTRRTTRPHTHTGNARIKDTRHRTYRETLTHQRAAAAAASAAAATTEGEQDGLPISVTPQESAPLSQKNP